MTGICSHLAYAVPHTLIITTNTPANMGPISVWRLTLRIVAAHVPQYLLPTLSSGTYRTQFRSHIYTFPTRVRNTLQTICFLKPFLVSLNSLCWSKLLERARLTRQTLLLRSQKSSWPDFSTTSLCLYDRVDENITGIMTSSNGNIFRVTGPLWEESTGHRWIPFTKASDAELSSICLTCAWTSGWAKVIGNAMALIVTSL